jgi:4-methylaminobutanoate oxidase (formaldehyde-forming)
MAAHVHAKITEVGESEDFKAWQAQQEGGEGAGLVHAGLKALSSLRLEKAYRDYGHDMDNTVGDAYTFMRIHSVQTADADIRCPPSPYPPPVQDTIQQMGLSFTCDFDKEGGFLGKEAVLEEKAKAKIPHKRLLQVLLKDPAPFMYHAEVVYRDGELGRSICSCMLLIVAHAFLSFVPRCGGG